MQTFYFHVRDGERLIEDLDGSELPDLEAARAEAVVSAREAIAEALRSNRAVSGRCFEITDEGGQLLATVTFRDVIALH